MEVELWRNNGDEYGIVIEDNIVKQRVYLENHVLLEGIDVSEIDTLNTLYIKELFKKKEALDNMDFLIDVSRDWFSITSYINRYVELTDCIVFNYGNNKFESLNEKYSDMSERYIEAYDEDGNLIIIGEFDFLIKRKLNIEEEGLAIKVEIYKEEHLYKINESDNYLYIKSDLSIGIDKGIIIGKSAANYLLNNNSSNIIKLY